MEQVNPVTEAEMRGIAERLISTVVGYSRQASELNEIKEQVRRLYDQVSELRGQNATLKTERDDALTLAVENEAKLNDARRHRDDLLGQVRTMTDTMVSRDARVRELEGLHTSAMLESQDWQRKHEYQERVVEDLRTQLSTVRERRDHWMVRAEDAERALAEANEKLTALEKQVSDIFGLVRPAPQVIAEVVAPPPQAQEVPAIPDPSISSSESGQNAEATSSGGSDPSPRPWWETPVSEQKVG